jgi:hypothetical protein
VKLNKNKMIYNNTSKIDRLMSNGYHLLSHVGHLRAKIGPRKLDQVYQYTHLSAIMCADILGG